MVGYFLIAIAIGLGTVILVYGAYGYGINTKTGDIIQNGLLFVDSKPGGAQIYLNGKSQDSNTSARLVLPSGDYTLNLKRDGYRDWQRNFTLQEHSIARYVYPFLFPVKPVSAKLKSYASMPPLVTQSLDRRWLLVQNPMDAARPVSFDQYDTNDLSRAPTLLAIPPGLLNGTGQLSVVEWATDNNNVLLWHTFTGGSEYIIFNRDKPAESVNINSLFKQTPSQVAMRNKKIDQLYLYNQLTGTIRIADTSEGTVADPILDRVLAFKPHGGQLITYVTDKAAQAGQVEARVWDDGRSYPLHAVKAGPRYLIDAAQFQGHWYYVVGSSASDRINVYKDPLSRIKNPSIAKAVPTLAFNKLEAEKVSFSSNARFIEVQKGQNVAVYDIETKQSYDYTLSLPLAGPFKWMDGHRLIGQSDGRTLVSDYDSANQQLLTECSQPDGGLFSRDFNHLLCLFNSPDGTVGLMDTDMRAGADLPN